MTGRAGKLLYVRCKTTPPGAVGPKAGYRPTAAPLGYNGLFATGVNTFVAFASRES
jgi:hypothetical protein